MSETAVKPLGRKAYGSIPHLPGSRRGPADRGVNAGQARICLEKIRDYKDRVIVQEKLDGSNVAVAKIDGEILALGRAGYLASTSPWKQHRMFADWVEQNSNPFNAILEDGERLCGEWLAQAHGTKYELHERSPFVAFDLMRGSKRAGLNEFEGRVGIHGVIDRGVAVVPLLWHGMGAVPLSEALGVLGQLGFYGAQEQAEGVVYRVERDGAPDFICKYVRPDKIDGKYLPGCNGNPYDMPEVWNWKP